MNFLSHYYFDRNASNCYHILGIVLPDLLKNADKSIVLHPEKLRHQNESVTYIIDGWNKHLEVDRYFHSSQFFLTHAHLLKNKLIPAIEGSPVKPFFLGHIALELMLDNLLLTTGQMTVDDFYANLEQCEDILIDEFLQFAGLKSTHVFFKFYDGFKKSRYLSTYANTEQVAYALKRICMRVWANPFTPEQEAAVTNVLTSYRHTLIDNYLSIFNEIEHKLSV